MATIATTSTANAAAVGAITRFLQSQFAGQYSLRIEYFNVDHYDTTTITVTATDPYTIDAASAATIADLGGGNYRIISVQKVI